MSGETSGGLSALVVDDEAPARSELRYLLDRDERIGAIHLAASGTDALRLLDAEHIDVIFSDISMPGLDGMELARILSRFTQRPAVVFVTAHDPHAVDAFAVHAVDYVGLRRGRGRPTHATAPMTSPSPTKPSRSNSAGSPASSTVPTSVM